MPSGREVLEPEDEVEVDVAGDVPVTVTSETAAVDSAALVWTASVVAGREVGIVTVVLTSLETEEVTALAPAIEVWEKMAEDLEVLALQTDLDFLVLGDVPFVKGADEALMAAAAEVIPADGLEATVDAAPAAEDADVATDAAADVVATESAVVPTLAIAVAAG